MGSEMCIRDSGCFTLGKKNKYTSTDGRRAPSGTNLQCTQNLYPVTLATNDPLPGPNLHRGLYASGTTDRTGTAVNGTDCPLAAKNESRILENTKHVIYFFRHGSYSRTPVLYTDRKRKTGDKPGTALCIYLYRYRYGPKKFPDRHSIRKNK